MVNITGNIISGNLWGVSLVGSQLGGPVCNLGNLKPGDEYNIGWNKFSNNGHNDTLCDFYNNTSNDIMAQNNIWNVEQQTKANIENVIFHNVDDENLGTVTFMPSYTNEYNPPRNLAGSIIERESGTYNIVMSWKRPFAPIFEDIRYNIYHEDTLIATIDTTIYSVEVISPGTYKYSIKAIYSDNVESEKVEKQFVLEISINDIINTKLINVYPNPVSDKIIIDLPNIEYVEIYNVYGMLIQKVTYSEYLDISYYENGVYILKIQTDKSIYTSNIIIRK